LQIEDFVIDDLIDVHFYLLTAAFKY